MAKHDKTDSLQKGELKTVDRVFETRDTITGKRKVRVDDRTVIYTRFATDEEAIANYRKVHGLSYGVDKAATQDRESIFVELRKEAHNG